MPNTSNYKTVRRRANRGVPVPNDQLLVSLNQAAKHGGTLAKENAALRAEVNHLRAQLGMGRKYTQ
jgi:cell division protein FtsB